MSTISDLNDIVCNYTVAYRKDADVVKEKDVGGIHVVEIFGYPEAPSRGQLIDVHFIKVGFTEAAADVQTFVETFKAALAGHGEFCDVDEAKFKQGPSYIEVGGWIGSQDQALRLFALIAHYGMGDVITPATLHVTDEEQANQMAGMGLVMGLLRTLEPAHA